jgi:hypothetical protein
MKTLATALILLFAPTAFAASSLHIAGHVQLRSLSPDGDLMLKIERHGAMVNADCMANAEVFEVCRRARRGQPAIGDAECSRGHCSWTRLEVSVVGIGGF